MRYFPLASIESFDSFLFRVPSMEKVTENTWLQIQLNIDKNMEVILI